MKEYNLNEKNAGITLIALVVTIIVILILAGISISMLMGQNGILNRASEAKKKTEIASIDEQRKLAQAEALMSTGKTTYKGVTLPEGFAPTKIDGEDSIDEGLVITDGYGNEYVWVEVPKTIEVYPTAGLNITSFSDEEYKKIEDDLHTYTSDYRKETSYDDTYASDATSGWFENNSAYNTAKQKMLKSVYQNGGFWVGRYEAGITKNRISAGDVEKIPLSKANVYPYNYITREQAKRLAELVSSGSYTSSLLYGIQWDLILKFIEVKTVNGVSEADKKETKENIMHSLTISSKLIGNYQDNLWKITNPKVKYSKDGGIIFFDGAISKTTEQDILLSTGASNEFKMINIYDIAGNVWEWTLESNNNPNYPRTFRGGGFNIESIDGTACRRSAVSTDSIFDVGFRVSIY